MVTYLIYLFMKFSFLYITYTDRQSIHLSGTHLHAFKNVFLYKTCFLWIYIHFLIQVLQVRSWHGLVEFCHVLRVIDSTWKHVRKICCKCICLFRKICIERLVKKCQVHKSIMNHYWFLVSQNSWKQMPNIWFFVFLQIRKQ